MKAVFALASLAAFLAPLVAAVDERELVVFNIGRYPSGTAFCQDFVAACQKFQPSNTAETYQGSYCVPGDFQGNNTDRNALAYCTFTVPETDAVVGTMGGAATS